MEDESIINIYRIVLFGCVMGLVNCPHCGRPLVRKEGRNRYCCENERCPVVWVRSPSNPFKRKVQFSSSVNEATVRKIEESTAHEILLIRLERASCQAP
jgi:uncharacterized Zn finger protein (UPF0148 family)